MPHKEHHCSHRSGWLRAAVMGANDGIVSTASLVIGVAAAQVAQSDVLLAGLVAGAMSMAAGEYVSVSSQADMEAADLELEQKALEEDRELEMQELAEIYRARGLDQNLAIQVADQLMAHNALEAHARDEIGITETGRAQPVLAGVSSALTFTVGAALPLLAAWYAPRSELILYVALSSLLFLGSLGAIAARAGGAPRSCGLRHG
ncbi:MAG: VIT family protein [Candidatus Thiodiazotropha sp.]